MMNPEEVAKLPSLAGKTALMIDNYDSFTFNLVQYLQELKVDVKTIRNDEQSAEQALSFPCDVIVISPGPSTPDNSGITLDVVAEAAEKKKPLFGICLGFQAIAQHFGATVHKAKIPVHGKVSGILHDGKGCFEGLPNPIGATRYHSLKIVEKELSGGLTPTAKTDDDGLLMGLRHKELPIEAVQFHPESVLTDYGHRMLSNFILQHCS